MLWEEAYDRLARNRTDPEVWSFIHAHVALLARRDVYRFGQEVVAEAAQEVCRQAFERFDEAHGRETFYGWISGLYRGVRRDIWRDEGRVALHDHGNADQLPEIESPGDDPYTMLPPDLKEALQHCLDQLNERMRQVAILRRYRDLSAEQVGLRMGMSAVNVRVTFMRAAKLLRACLGDRSDL